MNDSPTTGDDDLATEAAVLERALDAHPAMLTEPELTRELGGEEPSFAERDSIERAVRDLVGVGLLHGSDEFVTPTRAALRSRKLLNQ